MADRKPINPDHAVGNIAEVVTVYGDGQSHSSGRVIGYYARPSFIIERPDGTRFSWAASLTLEAAPRCANQVPSGDVCVLAKGHEGFHNGRSAGGEETFWRNRG